MVATATQSSSSSRMVSRETVGKAVDALLKWMRARAEQQQKAQLLDADDDLLYIVLTLKRIPSKSRTNPYRIPLPHPLYESPATSACLILDDRDHPASRRSSSSSLTAAAALDRARSLSLPIADAIPLSVLATDYRPFEARRRLCDSHDLFFADRAVLPLLPRLLGKHFFKKKKLPLPLDLSRPGWPEQLRACLRSTLLHLRTGSCSGLKVGRLSMDRNQIVDNVMGAIEGAMAHVPKKWAGVRSIHVKAVNSVALPIYQALPVLGLKIEVRVPRVPQKKDEIDQDVKLPIGEAEALQEEEEPKMKKTREVMQKKGRRIHEVQSMDTANDLDLEEFLISESVDEGIIEEEEREARMEERMDKKKKKNKTKEGVEVSIFKEKKKKKREDGIQDDKEEDSDRKGRDESMVAVAKKELKNDGKVKKEKDKKCRKHDESYDVGKNCDVDIGSGDNEPKKMGAEKKMKAAKKDANVKKGKDKRSDGSEDNDGDNRMAGKKVMKEMKRQKRKQLE